MGEFFFGDYLVFVLVILVLGSRIWLVCANGDLICRHN